jgi:hypothetical protein
MHAPQQEFGRPALHNGRPTFCRSSYSQVPNTTVKVISHKVQERHLAIPATAKIMYVMPACFCHLLVCLHRLSNAACIKLQMLRNKRGIFISKKACQTYANAKNNKLTANSAVVIESADVINIIVSSGVSRVIDTDVDEPATSSCAVSGYLHSLLRKQ